MYAATRNDVVLSGDAYVSARMRKPDNPSDLKLTKIPLRHPKNCDHVANVCQTPTCWETWQIDYEFFPLRTGGGRRLLVRYNELKAAQQELGKKDDE